ncbi:SDR family oxidoreductase [Mesorhizobium sp. M1A.F.Ca.ET.072.01.1.1]|uniref:SDR family NAD(P)-dependent oxidoreductase n=1 Tax=Mesorhizobium sp. M1A.F.Ca.ET.072.01.1.1 TaxID=2496753 RepID=UPI000FD590B7|nr:SDR family oxidoreductase [Mesorhizobium sp. M1A.F.Ca.ET.072.01.1.1]RUW54075.1 SDR family oxidoreductase [Mesorhizobium sp. M1A.F.Ca.ET.072.01.1.1]TIV04058.1 MAG: SDR family oxidoreductase [Mesorhizobium sp.]
MAKTAIVTGSATGMGATCAIELAARGWNVAVNYTKSKEEAEETYAKIKAKGVEAIVVQADVGRDPDCRKLADETLSKWGRIDGLINNAAITKFQKIADLEDVTEDDFDRIFRVNTTGAFMMSRAVYPAMRKQWEEREERGAIVNVSSNTTLIGNGSSLPYVLSKGALNTLTHMLARWLSPAVRVNAISPGFIQTRWMLKGVGEVQYNQMKKDEERHTALRQAGTPEHMSQVALFLLTEAANVTGQIIVADAGGHLGLVPEPDSST